MKPTGSFVPPLRRIGTTRRSHAGSGSSLLNWRHEARLAPPVDRDRRHVSELGLANGSRGSSGSSQNRDHRPVVKHVIG